MRPLFGLFAVLLVACQVESQVPAQVPVFEPMAPPAVVVAPVLKPAKLARKPVVAASTPDVRAVTCAGGETPSGVRTGCLCGSEIVNPCEWGGNFPSVEGNACVFSCGSKPAPETSADPRAQCLAQCNEETHYQHGGDCMQACNVNP